MERGRIEAGGMCPAAFFVFFKIAPLAFEAANVYFAVPS